MIRSLRFYWRRIREAAQPSFTQPPIHKGSSFFSFLRAFSPWWFVLMSGGPSVPAAILAYYLDPLPAKIALWATAAFCVIMSAYLVWRRERLTVIELEARLIPKIKAVYDPSRPPCRSISKFTDGMNSIDGMVYRVEVESLCEEVITDCEGYLTEVAFENEPVELGVMNLTWADMPSQTIQISLRKGVRRHLDVLVIYQNNQVRACSLGLPLNRQGFFSRLGNYRFTVVIGGHDVTLPPYKLRLHFAGDWQTATMEAI
jgi:hypothetical protein